MCVLCSTVIYILIEDRERKQFLIHFLLLLLNTKQTENCFLVVVNDEEKKPQIF